FAAWRPAAAGLAPGAPPTTPRAPPPPPPPPPKLTALVPFVPDTPGLGAPAPPAAPLLPAPPAPPLAPAPPPPPPPPLLPSPPVPPAPPTESVPPAPPEVPPEPPSANAELVPTASRQGVRQVVASSTAAKRPAMRERTTVFLPMSAPRHPTRARHFVACRYGSRKWNRSFRSMRLMADAPHCFHLPQASRALPQHGNASDPRAQNEIPIGAM